MNRRNFFKAVLALTGLGISRKRPAEARTLCLTTFSIAGFQYYDGPRIEIGLRANQPLGVPKLRGSFFEYAPAGRKSASRKGAGRLRRRRL